MVDLSAAYALLGVGVIVGLLLLILWVALRGPSSAEAWEEVDKKNKDRLRQMGEL